MPLIDSKLLVVAAHDGRLEVGHRIGRQDGQGDLGAHAVHADQGDEEAPLTRALEAEELQGVVAHVQVGDARGLSSPTRRDRPDARRPGTSRP